MREELEREKAVLLADHQAAADKLRTDLRNERGLRAAAERQADEAAAAAARAAAAGDDEARKGAKARCACMCACVCMWMWMWMRMCNIHVASRAELEGELTPNP